MIHLISQKATRQQIIEEMLEALDPIIKRAVEIQRQILTGGENACGLRKCPH